MESNYIRNIDVIGSLSNLEQLYLSNNNISNIDSLRNLTELGILYLDFNQIKSINSIYNLEKLLLLNIASNIFYNISINEILQIFKELMEFKASKNNLNEEFLYLDSYLFNFLK